MYVNGLNNMCFYDGLAVCYQCPARCFSWWWCAVVYLYDVLPSHLMGSFPHAMAPAWSRASILTTKWDICIHATSCLFRFTFPFISVCSRFFQFRYLTTCTILLSVFLFITVYMLGSTPFPGFQPILTYICIVYTGLGNRVSGGRERSR